MQREFDTITDLLQGLEDINSNSYKSYSALLTINYINNNAKCDYPFYFYDGCENHHKEGFASKVWNSIINFFKSIYNFFFTKRKENVEMVKELELKAIKLLDENKDDLNKEVNTAQLCEDLEKVKDLYIAIRDAIVKEIPVENLPTKFVRKLKDFVGKETHTKLIRELSHEKAICDMAISKTDEMISSAKKVNDRRNACKYIIDISKQLIGLFEVCSCEKIIKEREAEAKKELEAKYDKDSEIQLTIMQIKVSIIEAISDTYKRFAAIAHGSLKNLI